MSNPSSRVAKKKEIVEMVELAQSKGFMYPGLDLICTLIFTFALFLKSQLLFTRQGMQQGRDDLEQIYQHYKQIKRHHLFLRIAEYLNYL